MWQRRHGTEGSPECKDPKAKSLQLAARQVGRSVAEEQLDQASWRGVSGFVSFTEPSARLWSRFGRS